MIDPARLDTIRSYMRTHLDGADPAHDFAHVLRVEQLAGRIARIEGADEAICRAAALLHELFNHPKGHPESHRSGEVCAERATEWLASQARQVPHSAWSAPDIEAIAYAIRVHPFSLGVTPDTLEGRVLQDADRLDAIGAIGAARCFATCAVMRRPFYHPDDPFCETREPEDKLWGVDHFYRKLLRLEGTMHTSEARRLANERTRWMHAMLEQLGREIRGEG